MDKRPTMIYLGENEGDYHIFIQENEVMPIPKNERHQKIYKLLKEHCNLSFCIEEKSEDFEFVCLEQFYIFAVDDLGNCYGSIGRIGDINEEDVPIGMVTSNGRCAKVASCLREFLSLVTYYPYWLEIIELERKFQDYSIAELESNYESQMVLKQQSGIAEILNLSKDDYAIDTLKIHLKEEFIVYGKPLKNILD